MIIYVFLLSLFLFPTFSFGATINVPADYQNIQAAIDAASGGDTVIVADGTYTGEGNKNIDFKGKAITVQSENGAENCIIDCKNEGRGFYFHTGEGVKSVVSGFTVTNGKVYGNGGGQAMGGGILCNEMSSPTITNCIISGNQAISSGDFGQAMGGGINCFDHSSPTISNCVIRDNNSSGEGGGIYLISGSSPTITDCIITNNSATSYGGGISCRNSSSPCITNCTISWNTSLNSAGMLLINASPTLTKCRIVNNEASGHGGGMSCFESSPALTDCSISDNAAGQGGGGGLYLSMSYATISECIIENNAASSMGGGIYSVGRWSSLVLSSSKVIGNTADESGGGITVSGNASITKCTFMGNKAKNNGGAIFISASFTNVTLTNSIISENTCGNSGGGLSCDSFANVTLTNSIISENRCGNSGGGLSCDNDSSITISNCTMSDNNADSFGGAIYCVRSSLTGINCILWNNSPEEILSGGSIFSLTYSDIEGSYLGLGNIDADPLFVGGGVYQLTANSPCIDSGTSSGAPSTDIDGVIRPQGLGYDMGAYEYFLATSVPTATTGSATYITASSATLNGTLNPNGGSSWYYFEYGTSTSYGTTTENSTAGAGMTPVSVSADITGLGMVTTYHFRLVVSNNAGTNYGSDQTFTTNALAPSVSTGSATSVTSNSAILNGTINPNGASTTYYFEYGITTAYGSTTITTSAGSGSSAVSVNANIGGLSESTTYHFRLVATNSIGTTSGSDQTFATTLSPVGPTVVTGSATLITSDSATLKGKVNPNGSSTEAYFEYGTTTSYGSTTLSEDIGAGTSFVTVNATISDLIPDTIYHYRLTATNSGGTSSGADMTFYTAVIYVSSDGTCGGNTPCYSTIQAAIDAAETESVIRIIQGTFDEDIIIDQPYGLTLSGGWDSTFTSQSGTTNINSMTISNGTATIDNLVIQ